MSVREDVRYIQASDHPRLIAVAVASRMMNDGPPPPDQISWDIRLEGRAWASEAFERFDLLPEKTEMIDGKLFWSEADRVRVLGLLLENVGAAQAVRLGDPEVWRRAVKGLDAGRE